MIIKVDVDLSTLAKLTTFLASQDNQVSAPQDMNWKVPEGSYREHLPMTRLIKADQDDREYHVTLEVQVEDIAYFHGETMGSYLFPRVAFVKLLDAIGILPDAGEPEKIMS